MRVIALNKINGSTNFDVEAAFQDPDNGEVLIYLGGTPYALAITKGQLGALNWGIEVALGSLRDRLGLPYGLQWMYEQTREQRGE